MIGQGSLKTLNLPAGSRADLVAKVDQVLRGEEESLQRRRLESVGSASAPPGPQGPASPVGDDDAEREVRVRGIFNIGVSSMFFTCRLCEQLMMQISMYVDVCKCLPLQRHVVLQAVADVLHHC